MRHRVLQQLPVDQVLDQSLEIARRETGGQLQVSDVAVEEMATVTSGVDVTVEPSSAVTPVSDLAVEQVVVEVAAQPAGCATTCGDEAKLSTAASVSLPSEEIRMPVVRLLVPNATADVAYDYQPDLSAELVAGYRIRSIAGLDEIGLMFDSETNRLHGVPCAEPGQAVQKELDAVLECKDEPARIMHAKVALFINPHPRTLWKQIEPDASLEYRKEHKRSLCEKGPPMVLAASVRGRSHENSGAFREDDFHVGHGASGTWTVVAVSDGAGSAKLSRLGSQIATETSVNSLLASLGKESATLEMALADAGAVESEGERATRLRDVGRELLRNPVGRAAFDASKAIKAKAVELGIEEKALAATLMFAALRRLGDLVLVASYWIGDGGAALLEPESGLFHLLGEADSGEYSGQTRFLLSQEFPRDDTWSAIDRRLRFHCVPASTVLLLMTDGVSDPKFGTDNALRDPARWLSFWNNDLAAQLPLSEPAEDLGSKLEEYLQFWSQGEHDDRTLALVRWS